MKPELIEVFKWQDIRKEICVQMGIEEEFFRKYHKVVGGQHKDLWHEWLRYFDQEVSNDKTTSFTFDKYRLDNVLLEIHKDDKEWLEPFVHTVYQVWQKYNIEKIRYSW